jgi:hypothetical protein
MLSTPPAATAVELTEKRMFMLFPTPMFMGKLPDMSVAIGLRKKFESCRNRGRAGHLPKGRAPRGCRRTTSTIYPR